MAFLHQSLANEQLMHAKRSFGAGSRGASPIPGLCLRASSKATSAVAVAGVRCS